MNTNPAATTQPITEADLLRLSAGDTWYEISEGELIAVNSAGLLHVLIVGNVYDALSPYVKAHKRGYVITDGLHCILQQDAEGLKGTRIPDAAFISHERIPAEYDFSRPFPGAPDLVVEVVSPGEAEGDLLAKVRDFLRAGTQQVWALYPKTQEVHVYRRDEPSLIHVYRAGDTLHAPALFPEWSVAVGALFAVA